jgi:hypothetical protein
MLVGRGMAATVGMCSLLMVFVTGAPLCGIRRCFGRWSALVSVFVGGFMAKKQYKNMDRTSAGMAKALDERREQAKAAKQRMAAKRAFRDRTSLSRGGFR